MLLNDYTAERLWLSEPVVIIVRDIVVLGPTDFSAQRILSEFFYEHIALIQILLLEPLLANHNSEFFVNRTLQGQERRRASAPVRKLIG